MRRYRDDDFLPGPHGRAECRRILQHCLGGYMGVCRDQFGDYGVKHVAVAQVHRGQRYKAAGPLFESYAIAHVAHVMGAIEEGYNRPS